MGKTYIVANLKSHQNSQEAKLWLEQFLGKREAVKPEQEIILCPSFPYLSLYKDALINSGIKLGAQNVSSFEEGAYTGEVNAKQVREFADYVLIGHSERRRLLNETDELIENKVKEALSNGLIPIFFAQTADMQIDTGVNIVVYEPPDSISGASGGIPDSPEDVSRSAEKIKSKGDFQVLYGGSVNSANIKEFSGKSSINGVVVGGASLEAEEFIKIIQNA